MDKRKSEADDRFLTGVTKECRYDGCLQDNAWQIMKEIIKAL